MSVRLMARLADVALPTRNDTFLPVISTSKIPLVSGLTVDEQDNTIIPADGLITTNDIPGLKDLVPTQSKPLSLLDALHTSENYLSLTPFPICSF